MLFYGLVDTQNPPKYVMYGITRGICQVRHPIYWASVLAGASRATGKLPRLGHKEVSCPHRPCPCHEQK